MTETKQSAPAPQPSVTPNGSPSATATLSAADAMHAELLRQCHDLMGSADGSEGSRLLARIAPIVEAYEQARWPIGEPL